MILPIYAYGQPVLKRVADDITADYPGLEELIENMFETMYQAEGVGLAAPQIGLPIRLFVIDTHPREDEKKEKKEEPKEPPIKKVFINAHKVDETGEEWSFEEGCLSIPDIRGDVDRPAFIRLRYLDEHFQPQEEFFTGVTARVVQHEYDHIEGILFTERLKPIKKQLIKRKLEKIKKGDVKADYRLKFARK
ncbi:MAG: peptide deformylase [Lewinellaceae bacterium]|nr:peptide deformylase [Saprospiraceae bacterium]MCB9337402.1 peptide deformylase [Lewinellaceae bacterium]